MQEVEIELPDGSKQIVKVRLRTEDSYKYWELIKAVSDSEQAADKTFEFMEFMKRNAREASGLSQEDFNKLYTDELNKLTNAVEKEAKSLISFLRPS